VIEMLRKENAEMKKLISRMQDNFNAKMSQNSSTDRHTSKIVNIVESIARTIFNYSVHGSRTELNKDIVNAANEKSVVLYECSSIRLSSDTGPVRKNDKLPYPSRN